MSDFGTVIFFTKKDGNINDNDLELLSSSIKNQIDLNDFPSNIKEGNINELKKWDDNILCSMITEYFFDENENEIRAIIEEEDLPECKKIVDILSSILGNDFEITYSLEYW